MSDSNKLDNENLNNVNTKRMTFAIVLIVLVVFCFILLNFITVYQMTMANREHLVIMSVEYLIRLLQVLRFT